MLSFPESQCRALHALFEALTRQTLTLSYQRMQTWSEFLARVISAEDLRLVVRWLQAQITRGAGGFSRQSLQFGTLLADLDRFEDRLNIARAVRPGRIKQRASAVAPKISAAEETRLRLQRWLAIETLKVELGRP